MVTIDGNSRRLRSREPIEGRSTMDNLDDLLWGILILFLGTAVVMFANSASTGWTIIVGGVGAACGLALIARVFLRG